MEKVYHGDMPTRIKMWTGLAAGVIVVLFLGRLAHLYRIDAHVAVFLRPKHKAVIEAPEPVVASTELKSQQGSDREEMMNDYWLLRVNALRAQKNLLPLKFDSRLAATAKIWAEHMGTTGVLSHDRPNGETVNEWVKTYALPFTDRGPGGWNGNYFSENIGRAYADDTPESLQKGLDQVLTFMFDEGPDGAHYRTIFSPDWNSYGGGFYFAPMNGGRLQIYMAFHYASLRQN
jgi:uncharacterized protein YkwD